jgi:hypothetical protein
MLTFLTSNVFDVFLLEKGFSVLVIGIGIVRQTGRNVKAKR